MNGEADASSKEGEASYTEGLVFEPEPMGRANSDLGEEWVPSNRGCLRKTWRAQPRFVCREMHR